MRYYVIAGVFLALLVAWANRSWIMPDPAARLDLAAGRALYDTHCASCHGVELEGQPDWRARRADGRLPAPPHDQTGHTWHHSDKVLLAMTRDGVQKFAPAGYQSDMPAFGGVLTEAEIRAVLNYIKSRWPPEILARQQSLK